MTIQKISTELNSLNIVSNSGDTVSNVSSETIKESIVDGDAIMLTTILEKIVSKLDEITDKVNE
tara:strand:- start:330 stop:521 length:192 start_codon:yes stop_codon:yes gene_type:complete